MDGGQLNEAGRLPDPGGMSGGALWRTFDHGETASSSGPDLVRLVGIVQELIVDPPLLIATQIEYALDLIKKGYPDTRGVINAYVPGWKRTGWNPRF
jgi:hypothetical protein